MPSSSRPSYCSGSGRRLDSWRCTITSSLASRNSTVTRQPRALTSAKDVGSCSNSSRERTSTTTASRSVIPILSTRIGSIAGGRLSTTYHPRSSIVWAAVRRPAPDNPVTITISAGPCTSTMEETLVARLDGITISPTPSVELCRPTPYVTARVHSGEVHRCSRSPRPLAARASPVRSA